MTVPTPEDRRKALFRTLRRSISLLVVAAIAYFMGRSILSQWSAVRHYPWAIHPGLLAGSVGLVWLDFVTLITLWRFLLVRTTGQPLAFAVAYRVWFLSNFGKYLPGKVWTVMGMAYMLKEHQFRPTVVFAVAVLNQVLSIVSGLVLTVIVLGMESLHLSSWGVVLGVALSLVFLYPPFFERALNILLRLLRRETVRVDLSFGTILGLFVLYMGTWILYGLAFWAMMWGFGIKPTGGFWPVSGAFAASYIIGFLTLLAPGGLGPREGALTLLLKDLVPVGLAAPVAIIARVWLSLVELLGAAPLLLLRRRRDTF